MSDPHDLNDEQSTAIGTAMHIELDYPGLIERGRTLYYFETSDRTPSPRKPHCVSLTEAPGYVCSQVSIRLVQICDFGLGSDPGEKRPAHEVQ